MNQRPMHYRCANCHFPLGAAPPTTVCPRCQIAEYETYRPWHFSTKRILAAVFGVGLYLAWRQWMGPIYDPIWMIGSGEPQLVRLGLMLTAVLLPSVAAYVLFPRRVTGWISGVSVLVWLLFTWLLESLIFA